MLSSMFSLFFNSLGASLLLGFRNMLPRFREKMESCSVEVFGLVAFDGWWTSPGSAWTLSATGAAVATVKLGRLDPEVPVGHVRHVVYK